MNKDIRMGMKLSTIEYGGMIALDRADNFGWIPVMFPNSNETIRIHRAEVINVYR